MFPKMRRSRQQISKESCIAILLQQSTGVLALYGENGYPYALPLNFVYDNDNLYFHCAKEGYKLEAMQHCENASFCVIDEDQVIPAKLTTAYRSVIVFGKLSKVENATEKEGAMAKLCKKYDPQEEANFDQEMKKYASSLCVIKLKIEHYSGKKGLCFLERKEE